MLKPQNKYNGLSYEDLLDVLKSARPGKEARMLHHELRKHGSGLSFTDRYPLALPIIASTLVAILTNAILLAIGCLGKS